jgi:hypothetical protein
LEDAQQLPDAIFCTIAGRQALEGDAEARRSRGISSGDRNLDMDFANARCIVSPEYRASRTVRLGGCGLCQGGEDTPQVGRSVAGRPARCTSMGVDDLDLDGSRWIRARATQSIRSSAIRNSNAAEQARPEAEQGPEQDCPNAAQRNGNGQANQLAEKHVAVQQARSSTARASRSDAVGCDAAWGAQATRGGSEEGQAEGRHRDRSKFGWWWFLFPRMAFCTWRGAITVRRSLQLNNLEHAFG